MGDAPQPPDSPNKAEPAVDEDEYLTPKEVSKPDYVDVLPVPPDRTSSLEPHGSPIKKQDSVGKHVLSSNIKESPVKRRGSPSKSPRSPVKSPVSPDNGQISPVKSKTSSVNNQGSPRRSNKGSPVRKRSPSKKTPSPEKTVLHSPVTPTKSGTITDV